MRRSRVRISFAPRKARLLRGFFFGCRQVLSRPIGQAPQGEVAEWLNAAVLKTALPARATGVRIPPSPPTRPAQRATPPADMLPSWLEAAGMRKDQRPRSGLCVEASPPTGKARLVQLSPENAEPCSVDHLLNLSGQLRETLREQGTDPLRETLWGKKQQRAMRPHGPLVDVPEVPYLMG